MISADLRRFIGDSFSTVSHLEAALYFRARSDADIPSDQAASALYLSAAPMRDRLHDLCGAGILEETSHGLFRWAPRDATIAAAMDDLARVYAKELRGITSLIHDRNDR